MTIANWKQTTVDALFIAAEAVAWYIILRVAATALEQSALTEMADRIRQGIPSGDITDVNRARDVLDQIARASTIERGPSLLLVLATAFGGFLLMRGLMRVKFDGVLGAVVLLAASVLILNGLLHIAITGDLRVWDAAGLAASLADTGGIGSADLNALVRRPNLAGSHGATASFLAVLIAVMWVRFLLAARDKVSFERVLQSFTVGFVMTIIGVALAGIEGIRGVQVFAVPQFVLGILALAVANNARAVAPTDGESRTGPWIAAVGGTIGVLVGVALLLGLLAFLQVGVLLNFIGGIAWQIIAFLLLLIITPLYWFLDWVVRMVLPNGIVGLPPLPNMQMEPPDPTEAAKDGNWFFPPWTQDALKFLAVLLIAYVIYRFALLIMRRRRTLTSAVDEMRGQASTGVGLGSLLRGMLPGARRPSGADWLKLQAIYRLYARAATSAEKRGFTYLPGETPLQFTARAGRAMEAPPYPPIGLAFDRARYGRHYPEDGQVKAMEGALASWESATPPTDELRHRLAGASPLSDTQEFLLNVAQHKRVVRQNQPPIRGAENIQEPRDHPLN